MSIDTELELGLIETFAGNGKSRSTGDGKRAVKAGIPLPNHICFDKDEKFFYFAECGSDRVRRIDLETGILHNFAGTVKHVIAEIMDRAARRVCIYHLTSRWTPKTTCISVTLEVVEFGELTVTRESLRPWWERANGGLMAMVLP